MDGNDCALNILDTLHSDWKCKREILKEEGIVIPGKFYSHNGDRERILTRISKKLLAYASKTLAL